jgi:hypothetical protein
MRLANGVCSVQIDPSGQLRIPATVRHNSPEKDKVGIMNKKKILNILFVFIFLIFCYISSFIIITSPKSDLDYNLEIISSKEKVVDANLKLLLVKAEKYEERSGKNLIEFIKFVDKISISWFFLFS